VQQLEKRSWLLGVEEIVLLIADHLEIIEAMQLVESEVSSKAHPVARIFL
jgi:hypothetical protein